MLQWVWTSKPPVPLKGELRSEILIKKLDFVLK